MSDTKESIILEAIDRVSGVLGTIGDGLSNVAGIAAGAFAGGVLAAGAAMGKGIQAVNEWAGRLDSIGDVLGTNAKDSAALAVAIDGVGGNVENITNQMAFMQKGLEGPGGKLGPTGEALKGLGVSFKDANGAMLPANELLANVATKLNQMPDGLAKSELMMKLFGKSGKDMTDVMGALADGGLDKAAKKADELGLALSDDTVASTVELGKQMKTLEQAMNGVFVQIGTALLPIIVPLASKFAEFAQSIAPQVQAVIQNIAGAIQKDGAPAFANIQTAIQGVIAWVTANWPTFQTIFAQVFNAVVAFIQDPVTPTVNGIVALFGQVVAWLQANWPTIQATISSVLNAVIGFIKDPFTPTIQAIVETFAPVVTWAQENWPLIQQTVGTVMTAIQSVIETVLPIVRDVFNVVFPIIKGIVSGTLDAILAVITAVMQLINGDTEAALTTLQTTFGRIWESIRLAVSSALDSLRQVFTTQMNNVRLTFENILRGMLDYVKTLPAQFVTIGENLIKGLVDGILSAGSFLRQKFHDFLKANLPDWAAKLLGIASPSKVAAERIGAPFAMGIVAGILDKADAVRNATGTLTDSMMFTPAALSGAYSPATAGAGASGVSVIINVDRISSDLDIDEMAYRVAERIRRAR